MTTFSLSQCPHCAQANAQGTVTAYAFHATEPLNVSITAHCQHCRQALIGLGKIAFVHHTALAAAQQNIAQYEGPLEQQSLIQLIRWVPLMPAHAQATIALK